DDRDHGDDRGHADDDAEDGERRSQLVSGQRAGGELHVLADHSYLSASMGGSRAACRAGKNPASAPVITAISSPLMTSDGRTSVGSGKSAAMPLLMQYPRRTPTQPPPNASRIGSGRNC